MITFKQNKLSPMNKYYSRYYFLSKTSEAPDASSCLTLWKEIMNDITRNKFSVDDLDLDFMESLCKGEAGSESAFHEEGKQ